MTKPRLATDMSGKWPPCTPLSQEGHKLNSLLKARDVARLLGGISEAMVYALAKTGRLQSVRFAAWPGKAKQSTVRFTPEAVERFITEHTTGPDNKNA